MCEAAPAGGPVALRMNPSENSQTPSPWHGNVVVVPVQEQIMKLRWLAFVLALWPAQALAACPRDAATIIELDRQYQDAVFRNDAERIERLLPDDFALVTGRGKLIGKAELLREAREGVATYERQHDSRQSVRFIGDIAVISALLHAKGRQDGKPFDYRLWFSDVYLCTPSGWRYSFAQSSIPLPD